MYLLKHTPPYGSQKLKLIPAVATTVEILRYHGNTEKELCFFY